MKQYWVGGDKCEKSGFYVLFLLFKVLKIKKTVLSPLIFVSLSRLENSETKLRIETKVSETKLSGDSILKTLKELSVYFWIL